MRPARVIFECQGCGKQEDGFFGHDCNARKPSHWFVRRDGDGVQLACSRDCIQTIAFESGKTDLVVPI